MLLDLDSAPSLGAALSLEMMLGEGKTGHQLGEVLVGLPCGLLGKGGAQGRDNSRVYSLGGFLFFLGMPEILLSLATPHRHLLVQPWFCGHSHPAQACTGL